MAPGTSWPLIRARPWQARGDRLFRWPHPVDYEQGEIRPGVVPYACLMGLEGLGSKPARAAVAAAARIAGQGEEPASSVRPRLGSVAQAKRNDFGRLA